MRASQQRRAGRRDISIASGEEPEDDDGAMTEYPILILIIGISARRPSRPKSEVQQRHKGDDPAKRSVEISILHKLPL
ncbi:hypothetical protein CO659_03900 [Rhizobium sp. S9]|nr:hypothetical protein CO659_03900 [Rhizobium sp. S9]